MFLYGNKMGEKFTDSVTTDILPQVLNTDHTLSLRDKTFNPKILVISTKTSIYEFNVLNCVKVT